MPGGGDSDRETVDASHRRTRDNLAALLTIGTGSLNAVSFLALGHVFASVITGNLVLMGIGVAQLDKSDAVYAAVATLGYLVGAGVGVVIGGKRDETQPVWPSRVTGVFVVELALLAVFSAGWEICDAHPGASARIALLALLTATMGLQSAASIRLGVSGFSTTYLASTMITAVTELITGPRRHAVRKVVAGLGIAVGAAMGVALIDWAPRLAPLPAATVLLAVLVLGPALVRDRR